MNELFEGFSEESFDKILQERKKNKKKIKSKYFYLFAPFYGVNGNSAAEINTGNSSSNTSSPSYPGAGGINSPNVPPGPNSGMGPNV